MAAAAKRANPPAPPRSSMLPFCEIIHKIKKIKMNISSLYSTEIREHLYPYFANWEPSNPVALGDYGFLENNIFRQVGNLQRLGVAFTVRTEEGFSRKSGHGIKMFLA
jgi:hypothetical protein